MMDHFNWKRCSIIASNDAYGVGNANNLIKLSAGKIDIGVTTFFRNGATKEELRENFDALSAAEPKIIFLMAVDEDGKNVIDQAIEHNLMGPESGYTWVLSEGIASAHYLFSGEDVEPRMKALAGNIGTRPRGGEGEIWNKFVEKMGSTPTDTFVPYVIDAVYLLAHAYEYVVSNGLDYENGDDIVKAFEEIEFEGTTGLVVFQHRERIGSYDIVNFRDDLNDPIVKVLSWNATHGIEVISEFIWPDGTDQVPSDRLTDYRYISYDHPLGVTMIVLAGVFIILVALTAVVVYLYENTPVMRYSSPMFLGLILFGLAMVYGQVILWVGKPTLATCNAKVWIGFLGFVLTMAALITKTFRVYRIFKRRRKIKTVVITNFQLLKYVFILTIPMVVILILWTSIDMLTPLEFENSSRTAINVVCSSSSSAWAIMSFVYCGLLIAGAAFFSFKTRKIPDGFRETHWINLASYNAFFTAIVGITISYVLYDDLLATHIIIFICILIGVTSIWALIFLPKVRVAIFLKEKNTVQRSSGMEITLSKSRDFGQETSSIRSSES